MTLYFKILTGVAAIVSIAYYFSTDSPDPAVIYAIVTLALIFALFTAPFLRRGVRRATSYIPPGRVAPDVLRVGEALPTQLEAELITKYFRPQEYLLATAIGANFKSLVLTNESLIVVNVASFPKLKIDSLIRDKISGIETYSGAIFCGLIISLAGHDPIKIAIDKRLYEQVVELASRIRQSIRDAEGVHEPMNTDPTVMLDNLARLRDRGIISEEEFQTKKKELLSRI